MKPSKTFIIFFAILFLVFSGKASAQACGEYEISVAVRDERENPVKNASVKLEPIEKDETRGQNFVRDKADASLFSISYPEGYSFQKLHKLIVTAPGFKTAENKALFISCEKRDVSVKLARAKSASAAVWSFNNRFNLYVVGPDGKGVDGVKMTLLDGEKVVAEKNMEYGIEYFNLPNALYRIRFEKTGFETKEIEVDLTPLADKFLKVELTPKA